MRRLFRFIFLLTLALFLLSIGSVVLYRYVPVPVTPLMVKNKFSATLDGKPSAYHHDWIPMSEISPHLANAVIASEDQRFYQHNGFDWQEISNAIEERKTGKWLPYLSEGLRFRCSECGSRFDRPWHHCPNCGAKMEGD